MTLPTSVESPNAKFERAREHLNTLEDALQVFCDADSYVVTHVIDRERGAQFWRFDSDPPQLPIYFNVVLGDALYNFRCALDHLIWQLVLLNGNTPTEKNEFPVFKCVKEYQSAKKRKLRGVSKDAEIIIDRVQPYNRGHRSLWALHRLNITDKHRHLYLTNLSMLGAKLIQPENEAANAIEIGPIKKAQYSAP
jgi:hypothetical protein